MKKNTDEILAEMSKLALVAEAGKKLAEAAAAFGLTPEEVSGVVIAYANSNLK